MEDALLLLARANSSSGGFDAPKISQQTLLGTIWALTALSLLFVPARLYARWVSARRFHWDDLFVVFAWIISLAISFTITATLSVTYDIILIGNRQKPFPPNVKSITMEFTRVFNAVPMLFYGGLWSVKAAFLFFFYRLGIRNVNSIRRWFWIVVGITILSFLVCYTILPYRCTFVSFKITASQECQTQGLSFVSMSVNCALDVVTDLLIMSIPFFILRRVSISKRQKLALSLIFSLVLITIIFAIVRATITTIGTKKQIDPLWMYLWTCIELNVAIIVACIAPYRTFFVKNTRNTPYTPPNRYRSIREKTRAFFTSSGRRDTPMAAVNAASDSDIPYLAPWPVSNGSRNSRTGTAELKQMHCAEPYLTADLPRLEPWHSDGTREWYDVVPVERAYVRDHEDGLP